MVYIHKEVLVAERNEINICLESKIYLKVRGRDVICYPQFEHIQQLVIVHSAKNQRIRSLLLISSKQE